MEDFDQDLGITNVKVTIKGKGILSQSHKHDAPFLKGELPHDHDKRTYLKKLNVREIDGKQTVVIPAFGIHSAIVDAAQYSKLKIVGQRNATWTQKMRSGLSITDDAPLFIDPHSDKVMCIAISVHANGKRGSGSRVTRHFPQIAPPWSASFSVAILDETITKPIFAQMLTLAGMFIGVGHFRPQNGGSNGRFEIESLEWSDYRKEVRKLAA